MCILCVHWGGCGAERDKRYGSLIPDIKNYALAEEGRSKAVGEEGMVSCQLRGSNKCLHIFDKSVPRVTCVLGWGWGTGMEEERCFQQ